MSTCQNRLNGYDIKAREAQVVGPGLRIDAIPDADIPAQLRATVNDTRASIWLGPANPLPEYTRLNAKSPLTFRPHMEMGTAIFSGPIPPQERELAVLRCMGLRCALRMGRTRTHVHIGKRSGLTQQTVERVTWGCAETGWSEHEAAILCGIDELILDQTLHDDTAKLPRKWSEPQLIGYLMMVGHYLATSFPQNSLRDAPGL